MLPMEWAGSASFRFTGTEPAGPPRFKAPFRGLSLIILASITVLLMSPAQAAECLNAGAGAAADDQGEAQNTACGNGAGTGSDLGNIGNSSYGSTAGTGVSGFNNTAIGSTAGQNVEGSNNSALGTGAGSGVTGSNNVQVGTRAGEDSFGDHNIGIGFRAGADVGTSGSPVSNTISIGENAQANADNSVAIGKDATATMANQQVFGTATNIYTMPGIGSASTNAQDPLTRSFVTADAAGTLGTATAADLGLASATDISNLQSGVTGLQSQINNLGRRDRELANGIAVAVALAQPTFQPGQSFAIRTGWGNFDGSNAVAVNAAGVVGRFGPTGSVILDGGVGSSTQDNMIAGRAGLTLGW
jgi:hypothetical protein